MPLKFTNKRIEFKMNNTPDNPEDSSKKFFNTRSLRILWMILIPIFALVIILRLYNWSKGKDDFYGILAPLGMIFVGLSQIAGTRNKALSYALTGIAMVLVIAGLVMLIIR